MNKQINSYMITVAREARKLNQTELAQLLDIKQARLSKIEAGLAPVDEELLNKFSTILKFPLSFFYEISIPIDAEYKLHRKQSALPKKELTYISAFSHVIDLNISKLLNSVDIDSNIPEKFNLEYFKTPEDIAIALREYWKIPKGPIHNVTKLMEDAGIFIAEFDYPDTKFDGVSFYNRNFVPIVVVNKNLSADRDRFTKTHEAGHIIMHKFPSANADNEANRFAAEFLMPKKDIIDDLEDLSFYSLPNLKAKWKVSAQALIYRAAQLKTINKTREKSLWVQVSRARWKKEEPDMGIPKERPSLLGQIIDLYIKNLGYSKEELQKYFSINDDDFNFLYANEKLPNIKLKNGSRLTRVK